MSIGARQLLYFIFIIFSLTACGLKTEDTPKILPKWLKGTKSVDISWDQNKETGVNTSGGGYRVFIGNASGFDLSEAPYFDVTYESGTGTPLATKITTLVAGTYYLRVAGFNAQGVGAASSEVAIVVP